MLYPLKLPFFSSKKVTCKKSKNYEPKALNETKLPIGNKKKFYHFTHLAQDTPISTKKKEWGHEKKRNHTPEAKKKLRKVKRKQINWIKLKKYQINN